MGEQTTCKLLEEEYSALRKGQRPAEIRRVPCGAGAFAFHGDEASDEDWSLTYERERDRAVLPLCVGDWTLIEAECLRLKQDGPALDEENFPAVVFRGKRRLFRAAGGRYLIGVVELGGVVVLLGSTGASFVVVVRQGRRRHVIPTGATHGLDVLNLDELLPELDLDAPPRDRRPRSAERPEQIGQVAEHHDRILNGDVPSPATERVSIPGVVRRGLRWLADRAAALVIHRPKAKRHASARAKANPRRAARRERGTRFVYRLIEILLRLGTAGCGDLVGRLSEIQVRILEILPGEKISSQALSDALHRLHACKTCLVRKPSPRRWHVRLAGLTDWRTALHKRFCKETQTAYRLDPEPLRANDPVPPLATASDAPGVGDEGPSEPQPQATETPTTATPPAADPTAPAAPPHEPATSPDVKPTTTARSSAEPATAVPTATSPAPKDPPPTARSSSAAPATPPTTPVGQSEPDPSARLLVPPAPNSLYSQACTKVQVELEAVQRDAGASSPGAGPPASAADQEDPEEIPSAEVMAVVAGLVAEGLAQTQAELAAVRAAAAREAEEHARERDLLLQENQRVAAAAAALTERADQLLDLLSSIADRVPDPASD